MLCLFFCRYLLCRGILARQLRLFARRNALIGRISNEVQILQHF
jgi:hypothetical protein